MQALIEEFTEGHIAAHIMARRPQEQLLPTASGRITGPTAIRVTVLAATRYPAYGSGSYGYPAYGSGSYGYPAYGSGYGYRAYGSGSYPAYALAASTGRARAARKWRSIAAA